MDAMDEEALAYMVAESLAALDREIDYWHPGAWLREVDRRAAEAKRAHFFDLRRRVEAVGEHMREVVG